MQKINDEIYNAARAEHDKENYEKAFKLYSEGVEQGDVRCNYGVALFYRDGKFVEKDETKAAEIFASAFSDIKELAEKNEPISCCIIGFYYFNGFYVSEDKKVAIEWLKKSASLGYALAQNNVALRYYNGLDVEEDKAEAVKWYRKAAEQGLAEAQYNLGVCYNNGDGVKIDKEEAVKWYKKAAEQGYATAQYNLGNCYYNGEGIKEDKAEAVIWYQKAAKQGDVGAQYVLGVCYCNGYGVEKDKEKAFIWHRRAAKQGNSSSQLYVARSYDNEDGVKKDEVEAIRWYSMAAEQKEPDALLELGILYYCGKGVKEDKKEAVRLFKLAVEKKNVLAMIKLALCYSEGEGVEQDPTIAFQLFAEAANLGNDDALVLLGDCYLRGEGVERDCKKAVDCYKDAADAGNNYAKFLMASLYKEGDLVKQDGKKALTLYKDLLKEITDNCSDDDLKLCDVIYFDLARMYDENCPYCIGVFKDNFKAKEYYEKAIVYGFDCKSNLVTLETSMNINDSNANRMGEFVKEIEESGVPLCQIYPIVEKRLKQEFANTWEKLQKNTQECLITGCITYVSLVSMGENNYKNMDFSSAILPMVKACEIEFGRIFFDKFLEYLQKNNIPPTEFDPEMQKFVVEDKVNNKPEEYNSDEKYIYYRVEKSEDSGLFNYVSPDKTGVFTLGGMDKYAGISKGPMFEPIMQTAKFSFGKNCAEVERKSAYGKTKIVITVNKHVLAFMNEVFTEDAFPGDDREEQIKKYLYSLSTRVRDMAFKLRNPSSHTGVMPFWKALYCANMVIMVDRILFDFVSKLKPEYVALPKVYLQSLEILTRSDVISVSLLQSKLYVGFPRAIKIISWMEEQNYVKRYGEYGYRRVVSNEYLIDFLRNSYLGYAELSKDLSDDYIAALKLLSCCSDVSISFLQRQLQSISFHNAQKIIDWMESMHFIEAKAKGGYKVMISKEEISSLLKPFI